MAAALAVLTACEYEFDNGALTDETSIYVESIVSNSDTNILRIVKTLPYNTAEDVKDSANLNVTKVSSIELLRDGARQEVFYADSPVGSVARGRYYTLGGYKPGEKLSLKVEMEGEKKVSAETVIPEDAGWSFKVAELDNGDDKDIGKFHIDINFDNTPECDDFYGIKMEVRSTETYYNEDGSENTYYSYTFTYNANPSIDEGDDIEEIMSGEGDSHVFEYNDIYLFDDSSLKSGRNTISYDTYMGQHRYFFEQVATKGYGDSDWQYPVRVHTEIKYKLSLYTLSRELYRWYASRYNASYNALAELGLCPPSFAYGNVKDGIGCFAGRLCTASEWVVVKDEWSDLE